MGRVNIILSDDLEHLLRLEAGKKFGARKGSLTKAIEEAIKLWIEKNKKERGGK